MFSRVLIANRGEVACRIQRTCQRLGIGTVAVHSTADAAAPHVQLADEAVEIGPPPAGQSYLRVDTIVEAALRTRCDAVHPGYGFLSESSEFAAALRRQGVQFVGPSAEVLRLFGDKIRARSLARDAGLPPPVGTEQPVEIGAQLQRRAGALGYPLLVKAAAGGGGIGLQVVRAPGELEAMARSCADRALRAFGDPRIYLERYLERARHIEVQVIVDAQGHVAVLGDRECSVQRRYQKVVEEAPAPDWSVLGGEARRGQTYEAAARIVGEVGYVGVGTIEVLFDADARPSFLEVNARLQVEHAVTEAVTGIDLVEWQLRVAAGEQLDARVTGAETKGHAIEARVYAEDPARGFRPQPGRIDRVTWPGGAGIRVDTGVEAPMVVTQHYDPLLAKVIAWGSDRQEATKRLARALGDTEIALSGPKGPRQTNLELLREVLRRPEFIEGRYDTSMLAGLAVLDHERSGANSRILSS